MCIIIATHFAFLILSNHQIKLVIKIPTSEFIKEEKKTMPASSEMNARNCDARFIGVQRRKVFSTFNFIKFICCPPFNLDKDSVYQTFSASFFPVFYRCNHFINYYYYCYYISASFFDGLQSKPTQSGPNRVLSLGILQTNRVHRASVYIATFLF